MSLPPLCRTDPVIPGMQTTTSGMRYLGGTTGSSPRKMVDR
jgi:hypothetical protein